MGCGSFEVGQTLGMELLIVRHGRPEEHVVADGAADPGLTEIGHQQAEAVAEYLATQGVDHIMASPMRRARETAAPLARILGFDIEIVDDFKESDFESKEYKPMEENREETIDKFVSDPDHIFGTAGREAFLSRVNGAFNAAILGHGGQTVAVFCHGMVTAAFVATVMGIEDVISLAPDYTGLTRVRASTRHSLYSVRSFNETMHLRDLPDLRW